MPEFRYEVRVPDVVALRETPSTLLCKIAGKKYWFPHDAISDNSTVFKKGHRGELVVSSRAYKNRKQLKYVSLAPKISNENKTEEQLPSTI